MGVDSGFEKEVIHLPEELKWDPFSRHVPNTSCQLSTTSPPRIYTRIGLFIQDGKVCAPCDLERTSNAGYRCLFFYTGQMLFRKTNTILQAKKNKTAVLWTSRKSGRRSAFFSLLFSFFTPFFSSMLFQALKTFMNHQNTLILYSNKTMNSLKPYTKMEKSQEICKTENQFANKESQLILVILFMEHIKKTPFVPFVSYF